MPSVAPIDLTAVSLPEPGPCTLIPTSFIPCSIAFAIASATASVAAKGVDFLEPLNPNAPAELHAITFPSSSVTVITVLLKVAAT